MKASVVIGSGLGDEGKGMMTDYLASRAQCPLVVRFSGGANAGHTVQTPDGKKHVFGHIGSGTFAGAPTFLGEHFVVNPIIFKREREQMVNLGVWSKVYVDERAIITTPYDMLINQIAEAVRGAGRHGSVGVGLNETVERNLHPEFSLRYGPLGRLQKNEVRQRLTSIREGWVPGRLVQLGIHGPIDELTDSLYARLESEEILDQFMDDIFKFYCSSINTTPAWLFENLKHDAIIFEGAQGLMLDQNHAWFPHVTRANTGLTNVLEMAREVGIDELDVYYLHRAYTTRHGAGPLPHELPEMPYPGIIDLTNKPNAFQGTLRFALPDLDIIAQGIAADFKSADMTAQAHLVVTCLDQVPEDVKYVKDGFEREESKTDFLIDFENALKEVGVSSASVMTSYGPTREKIWKQRVNGKKILGAKEADYMGLDQVTHEIL